ncbi:hypothetical protein NLX83_12945 [Allokutzneria sp. A3M-2-11 16]|uniref:hypothetical protein n=1 Tax=Allokutzneria sp. A3M-2-11 16 TaxID=2962043 RepID=UPI0020B75930|nr:hypothetical protein [Allokutzneria sp. A3M-2-11 16]MCP3800166.1 hypothetical protein [Allokutzneria sp. A3M-2-11 16]
MSVAELRAAFEVVRQHLGAAGHHARVAAEKLAEATEEFTDVSSGHQRSLLPPELARAEELLERLLGALAEGAEAVDGFASAL